MPDVFSKKKRSEVMSRIRSRGNKNTELRLVRIFRSLKSSGWRRHLGLKFGPPPRDAARDAADDLGSVRIAEEAAVYGALASAPTAAEGRPRKPREPRRRMVIRPDFVFSKLRLAVFVDGCFWHGCPRCYVRPKQNRNFWDAKREANRTRDREQSRILKAAGWRVLRIWEHELSRKNEARLLGRLRRVLGATETTAD